MKQNKIIFHIDFDSYFVSAHRAINANLRNKPVAVSKNEKNSICSSVSYELKNLGIKAGDPVFKIKKICPNTIFVVPDYYLYLDLSNDIFEYIQQKYSNQMEIFSIDECWIDMTDKVKNINLLKIANNLKQDIYDEFRIPISVGISYNKFLAKMATNLAKPFGVFLLNQQNLEESIWNLPIEKFFGIGKSNGQKLLNLSIDTIGKLAQLNPNSLEAISTFGKFAQEYINKANGISSDALEVTLDPKSKGKEMTFENGGITKEDVLMGVIDLLSKYIAIKLNDKNLVGNAISLRIRNQNGKWLVKQKLLNHYINNSEIIFKVGKELFFNFKQEYPIRGIGIYVNNLKKTLEIGKDVSLFDEILKVEPRKFYKVDKIINEVNFSLKKNVLKTGKDLLKEEQEHKSFNVKFFDNDIKK
ncbi:Y-family DNA polymerase [Mycoplasmopsis lipophila]|uniref:Y-family DNA polymerase n=1 Tax=Mycoplasmopsis lipophila TaxID=2117 RepID=UPI003872ADF1